MTYIWVREHTFPCSLEGSGSTGAFQSKVWEGTEDNWAR